jgi:two-component system, NarL family, response regulator NreC
MGMTKTRILLAEDHAILREGIRSLLSAVAGLEVIGEAEDGRQAVQAARDLQPDLIVIDLSMPLLNGTEAIRQIKRRQPQIRAIVMTVHKSDEYVRATLDAGADGYLLKDDSHHDLLAAIRSVTAGGTYLSPKICGRVVSGFLGQASPQGPGLAWDALTDREREVLKLVAEGHKNREIAERLCVTVKTVEKHRANVMRKLDVHGAAGLTAYAMENGLVTR